VSVSPAVNVPPHALPTKEAVNWESLSDMTNMMSVPTVKGAVQSINDGWPLAACSRRSSIGDTAFVRVRTRKGNLHEIARKSCRVEVE
jgi:hypothetical protein